MFKKILHGLGHGLAFLVGFALSWYIYPFVFIWARRNWYLDEDEFYTQLRCYIGKLLYRYTLMRTCETEEEAIAFVKNIGKTESNV